MTMLSNQINQQSMQQQMFQHSLKMQMDALEKKGDMREVYKLLKQIKLSRTEQCNQ